MGLPSVAVASNTNLPGDPFKATGIQFLGEQDGPPERELKAKWVERLEQETAPCLAYLARVRYSQAPQESVILCVYTEGANPMPLLKDLGRIFHGMFSKKEHLDMLPLSEGMRKAVDGVCRPFFNTFPT